MCVNNKRWIPAMCKGLLFFIGWSLVFSSITVTADENGKGRKRNSSFASYGNYPHDFTGRGVLDDVSSDFVVISDSQYPLAAGATFNIPGQTNVSSGMMPTGVFVAFVRNQTGEIESLWRLKNLTDCLAD